MSHGPPDLPIHLVPPLGGLLSTRGGHGKELQPCFTIREDLTDRAMWDVCVGSHERASRQPTRDHAKRQMTVAAGASSTCPW